MDRPNDMSSNYEVFSFFFEVEAVDVIKEAAQVEQPLLDYQDTEVQLELFDECF